MPEVRFEGKKYKQYKNPRGNLFLLHTSYCYTLTIKHLFFRALKVRIIEYDASGFNQQTENSRHEEFVVRRFIKHPKFDSKRLSDDIAVLILDRPIDLLRNKGVNAACYPQCNDIYINTGCSIWIWDI